MTSNSDLTQVRHYVETIEREHPTMPVDQLLIRLIRIYARPDTDRVREATRIELEALQAPTWAPCRAKGCHRVVTAPQGGWTQEDAWAATCPLHWDT